MGKMVKRNGTNEQKRSATTIWHLKKKIEREEKGKLFLPCKCKCAILNFPKRWTRSAGLICQQAFSLSEIKCRMFQGSLARRRGNLLIPPSHG